MTTGSGADLYQGRHIQATHCVGTSHHADTGCVCTQAVVQTFTKGGTYKRPAVWEQPDVLRQFQEHVLETTKNAFSLEDTKRHAQHNNSYVQFLRRARNAKQDAEAAKDESQDTVNLGMHPYRYWDAVAECDCHCNS